MVTSIVIYESYSFLWENVSLLVFVAPGSRWPIMICFSRRELDSKPCSVLS
jgi:hypothetical protein